MDPLTLSLIMGGVGLVNSQMNRSAQADANRANAQSAAAQTQFSPYTKMGAGSYTAKPLENPMGGAMAGAATGLNLSQSYNKAQNDSAMMDSQRNMLDRMNNGFDRNQVQQTVQQAALSPYTMSYDTYGSRAARG